MRYYNFFSVLSGTNNKCTLAVTGQYFRQSKSRPDLAVEKDKDLQISLTPIGHLDIELPFLEDDEDIIW